MDRRAWVVAGVMGCATVEEGAVPDEVPYVLDASEAPAPAVSADVLAARIQEAFDGLLALGAEPAMRAYQAAVVGRDAGCPTWSEVGPSSQWFGDCQSASGAEFSGFSTFEITGPATPGDGYGPGETTRYLYSSASVRSPQGHLFQGGGAAYTGGAAQDEGAYGYSGVFGTFRWDGPETAGTWVADGTELNLQLVWQQTPDIRLVQAEGSLVTADGDAIAFAGVTVIDRVCPQEPAGSVSVRGADGWYDVIFDVEFDRGGAFDPATCDGCGTAWYRGERVGEVCVDVTGLAAFEVAPW